MTTAAPTPEMIARWRQSALKAIDPMADVTPTTRQLAWRFLLQHGVGNRAQVDDARPRDTEPKGAA